MDTVARKALCWRIWRALVPPVAVAKPDERLSLIMNLYGVARARGRRARRDGDKLTFKDIGALLGVGKARARVLYLKAVANNGLKASGAGGKAKGRACAIKHARFLIRLAYRDDLDAAARRAGFASGRAAWAHFAHPRNQAALRAGFQCFPGIREAFRAFMN